MYIEKISIVSFGTLKNKEYTFSDSFNIIEGSNESGKTTLMNFVLFILYGTDSDLIKRMKNSGDVFSGKITLFCERFGKITIARTASAIGAKSSDHVTVTSNETLKEISIGKNTPGDFILGVNREFFENTVFVSQCGASQYDADSASNAVQNILNSANEKMSTDKGKKKLDETRKNLKHKNNKGGAIYTISSELSLLEAELEGNQNRRMLLREAQERITRLQAESQALDVIPQLITNEKNTRNAEKLRDLKKQHLQLQNEEDQEKKRLETLSSINKKHKDSGTISELRKLDIEAKMQKAKIDVLDTSLNTAQEQFNSMNENKALIPESVDSYIKNIQNIYYSSKKYLFSAISVFSVVAIAMILGIVCIAYSELVASVALFICCIIGLAGGFVLLSQRSNKLKEVAKELETYAFNPNDTLRDIYDEFERRKNFELLKQEKQKEIEHINHAKDSEYNIYIKKTQELKTLLTTLIPDNSEMSIEEQLQYVENLINQSYEEEADLCRKLNELSYKKSIICEEITRYRLYSDIAGAPDPKFREYSDSDLDEYLHSIIKRKDTIAGEIQQLSVQVTALEGRLRPEEHIEKEISAKKELLQKREEQFEIVTLAQEALEKASENIRCAVTPNIIRICDSLIAEVTNGRYEHIGIDTSLSLNGMSGEEVKKHNELSYGTNEAMYLAFRLSLCTVLCKSEMPPLMLDESLAHIDDSRSSVIMKMLFGIKAQTLLFTCSKRESHIATNSGIPFNLINI